MPKRIASLPAPGKSSQSYFSRLTQLKGIGRPLHQNSMKR